MSKQKIFRDGSEGVEALYKESVSPRIGTLAAPGPSGEIVVEYDGKSAAARLLSSVKRNQLIKEENRGRAVLLVFEEGDPDRPIIVGLMEDPLEELVSMEFSAEPSNSPKEARVDGKRVAIEAQEEITLKCGAGSITLRKDGKIIIKGTHLLSRSSGPIRVKGARVDIN